MVLFGIYVYLFKNIGVLFALTVYILYKDEIYNYIIIELFKQSLKEINNFFLILGFKFFLETFHGCGE